MKKSKRRSVNLTGSLIKNDNYAYLVICLFTLIAYSTGLANGITNWDDSVYLFDNPLLKSFSLSDIFSTTIASNYHPITILSYSVEHHFFGFEPKVYHGVNILLHVINGILIYKLFAKLSSKNVALIISLLFCLHPMHVESVAWISERKDLLYACFFLLSLNKYVDFVKGGQKNNNLYLISILFFLLALLSKGMAVTLFVFVILIDVLLAREYSKRVMFEKLPYLVLSILFGIIAIMAQGSTEALELKAGYTFLERIMFASYAFSVYLFKFIFPINLSAFYTYPDISKGIPSVFYLSFLTVALYLGLILWSALKKQKVVLVGLLLFAGSISIVLQLLPVGSAIVAERYTYIPYIGLFFIVAHWVDTRLLEKRKLRQSVTIILVITGVLLAYLSRERCKVWKNSDTLWSDVIRKQPDADLAYLNRGIYIVLEGRKDQAFADFTKAIELNPKYKEAYNNRGLLKQERKQYDASIDDFNLAIESDPSYFEAYSNRGISYLSKGMLDKAIEDFDKTLELNPEYANVYSNRGNVYVDKGNPQKGLIDLKYAQQLYKKQGNMSGLSRVASRIRQVEASMQK